MGTRQAGMAGGSRGAASGVNAARVLPAGVPRERTPGWQTTTLTDQNYHEIMSLPNTWFGVWTSTPARVQPAWWSC